MIDRTSQASTEALVDALQRPDYKPGSYLAEHDLLTEQRIQALTSS